jgi:NDP-sugar pyrophosphorylase family protein
VAFHKEKGALATIALRRVYDTSEFGVVEIDEDSGILGFQEKPNPRGHKHPRQHRHLRPRAAGAGVHPRGHLLRLRQGRVPEVLEHGERFVGYQGDFYWSDIGTLEAYRQAQYDVLSGRVGVEIPGEKRGESLWVGEYAQIHPAANIEGHVLVGRDAVVGRGVTLSGDVTVGTDCWVRPDATIKRSILLPGSMVGDGAYLEDCIVGHGYNVRPGETIRGGALIRKS